MKSRLLFAALASSVVLASCDGMREALTAHVDVVARAEDKELSVNRLSDLIGNSTLQIPVNKDIANIVADLWVNYHLLGVAAARGDSLSDPKAIDEAALGITSTQRLRRFMESLGKTMKGDSASEGAYNQAGGGLFVAKHILFAVPAGASPAVKDSVRKKAEGVRGQLTSANFGAMAKKYSADPGSAARGGDLGAFQPSGMTKPFGDAVQTLRPGQISGLVETEYGYHIIQRTPYSEAKGAYDAAFQQRGTQRAESLYVDRVDKESKIELKPTAAATAKETARNLSQHRTDTEVMATYSGGSLTVGHFVRWLESFPPQARIQQQMEQAPDSVVRQFVKSIARNEVLLKKADSAGVVMSAEEKAQLYGEFKNLIGSLWQQLGIDPKSLADSGKSAPERERIAAARVEAYLDKVMIGQAQPVSVPVPVQTVLGGKYKSKVNPAGIDRAVERAKTLRSSADSTRAAQQPKSQVPMPMPRPDAAAPPRDTVTGAKKP